MRSRHPIHDVVAVVGDVAAPFELGIVGQAFGLDREPEGLPTYDFAVCGERPGRRPSNAGYDIDVAHGLDRLASADLVVVPAWPTLLDPTPPAVVEAVRAAAERGAVLMSICSGAFVLADAGLLDERRATTHWQFVGMLADRAPHADVVGDVLYVDEGSVVTSAGAAAGIDACLHVVRREHGAATANALARRMVVAAHRSGGQAQFVETPVPPSTDDHALAALLDWAAAHLDEVLTVDALAARAAMSPRTFARRFRATTGTTPHRWVLDQRIAAAEALLERTELPIDAVAREVGLGAGDTLRHHFARRRGTTPSAHRRAFRTAVR